jgi:ubiquinone/menaquinone biosynthesis C-methylase UbiE
MFINSALRIVASVDVYRDYNLGVSVDFNPFVFALKQTGMVLDRAGLISSVSKNLENFYQRFSPSTIFELLDLSESEAPSLVECKAWTAPYPWEPRTIEDNLRIMSTGLVSEASSYGFKLNILDGCSWCGPVTRDKLELEVQRYVTVMESIRQNGFLLDDDWTSAVSVVALVSDEGRYGFLLQDGAHRFSAAAALGARRIPYRVVGMVYRGDVDNWPNVKSGIYTKVGALRLFDRFLNGLPSRQMIDKNLGEGVTIRCARDVRDNARKPKSVGTGQVNLDVMEKHPAVGDCYHNAAAINYDEKRKNQPYWKAEDAYMLRTLPQLEGVSDALDVAAGTGRFIPFYLYHGWNVTTLDSSEDMLKVSASKLTPDALLRVQHVKGVANELPFPDDKFDLVVCFRFLSWIVPFEIAIESIREIARVSSRYVILELCVNKGSDDKPLIPGETIWNKLTEKSLRLLLHSCGLETIHASELIDLYDHPGLTAFLCKKIEASA